MKQLRKTSSSSKLMFNIEEMAETVKRKSAFKWVLDVKPDSVDSDSFLITWEKSNGAVEETRVHINPNTQHFCYWNGNFHEINEFESLLHSILKHCDSAL